MKDKDTMDYCWNRTRNALLAIPLPVPHAFPGNTIEIYATWMAKAKSLNRENSIRLEFSERRVAVYFILCCRLQ